MVRGAGWLCMLVLEMNAVICGKSESLTAHDRHRVLTVDSRWLTR